VEIWPVVHAERRALATDLSKLDDAQWAQPSLCADWSVRQVVAHMSATARVTPLNFFPKMVGSGFSLTRMQAKDIAALQGKSPAETLANFEGEIDSVKPPPGPPATVLGETIVHAEDVRRPLGLDHEYPVEAVRQVADFYKGSNLIIGGKRRIAGLSLRATDTDWAHGSGPEVSGPLLTLLMAMTGRKQALDSLAGEGVATLRGRP
jgi:uncharacterized protein (TIGR03083 family)